MVKIQGLRFESIYHPPYSPDLIPNDSFSFPQSQSLARKTEIFEKLRIFFAAIRHIYLKKEIAAAFLNLQRTLKDSEIKETSSTDRRRKNFF